MRILVAHQVPPTRTGGMSRIMGFIHDELAASDGWETEHFCADRLPAGMGEPWSRAVFPLLVIRQVRAEMKAGKPFDVVNIHEPHAGQVVAARHWLGGAKLVVTSHGLESRAWELDQEEARRGRRRLGWKSRLARGPTVLWPSAAGLRRADHVLCLNEADAAEVVHRYQRPRETVTRIFPAAGPAFAAVGSDRVYAEVPPDGGKLLFAGTWRPNKGTADLVPAFHAILSARPAARLTVLGGGVPTEVVRAAFGPVAGERVDVIQARGDAEAATVLAMNDIFLLPSLFEGTPLTLMEAMAAGLPVVTTATCGMLDTIRDGENGRLVPIREPDTLAAVTLALLAEAPTRARLGRTAHADAGQRFTWTNAAGPVRVAYRRLVNVV